MFPSDLCHTYGSRVCVPIAKMFCLEDFKFGKIVGVGTFGRVYIAKHIATGKIFVIKSMKKREIVRLNQIDHIFSERNILASVSHPFILKLYCTFQDRDNVHMLLEYLIGGELFTYLRKYGRFSLESTRFYAAEIVLALEYLHSKGIVYRDLKPENLLLDSQGHLKIADFGFSKYISEQRTWTLCGTPEYLAPEIIQNKGHGMAVDWWALGILIYEMIVGSPPYYDSSPYKIYEKILEGSLIFPKWVDDITVDFVQKLLCQDPAFRLGSQLNGSKFVKDHLWFKEIDWESIYSRKSPPPIRPEIKSQDDTSNFDEYTDDVPISDSKQQLIHFDGY